MSASSNSQYQTNPLKEDAELKSLLKDLETSVKSEKEFEKWRNSFLSRFIEFLDAKSTEKAEQSYWKFSDTMSSFVRVMNKLNAYIKDGSLSEDKCSVKALQCLQELSRTISLVVDQVDQLLPGTIAMERQAGFTKFHIGAVLVRDGFREYARMSMCADALEQMEKTLKNVADKLVLLNMNSYLWKLNVFCDVMGDLGLFNAMLKCREYVRADDDEEALLLTSSVYPSFDPDSSITLLERSNPSLRYDEASPEEPLDNNLERSLTLFDQFDSSQKRKLSHEVTEQAPKKNAHRLIDTETSVSVLDQSDQSLCIVPPSPSQEIVVFGPGKNGDAVIPYPNLHVESSITVVDRSISLIDDTPNHASSLSQNGFPEREPAPYCSSSEVAKFDKNKDNDSMKARDAAPYSYVWGQNASRDAKKPMQRVRWNPIDYYRGKTKRNNPDIEKEKKSLKNTVPTVEEPTVENQAQPAESEAQEKKNILSFLYREPKDDASSVLDSNDNASKASSDVSSQKIPQKPLSAAEQHKDTKEKAGNSQSDESLENDSNKPSRRQRKWSLKDFYTGAKERISNNLPKKKEKKKKPPRHTQNSTNENQSAQANPPKQNAKASAEQEDVNVEEEDDVSESSTMVSDADVLEVKLSQDLANQGSVSVIEDASESSTMVSDTEDKTQRLSNTKKRETASKKSTEKSLGASESDAISQIAEPKPYRAKESEQSSNRPIQNEQRAQIQAPKETKFASKNDKNPPRKQDSSAKEKPVTRSKVDSGLPPSDQKQRRPKKIDPVSKASGAISKPEKTKVPPVVNDSVVKNEATSREESVSRSVSDSGLPPSGHQKNPRQKKSDTEIKGKSDIPKGSHVKKNTGVNDESTPLQQPPVATPTKSDPFRPSSDNKQCRPKKQDSVPETCASIPASREKAASGTSEKPLRKKKADSSSPDKEHRQPAEPEAVGPTSSGDSAVSICAVQPALRSSSESPMEALLRVQRQMDLISKTNSVDMYVLPELAPYGYADDTFAEYLPVNAKNQALFEELDRIYQATARKLHSYICYGTIGWNHDNTDSPEDLETPNFFIRQIVVDRLGNQIATYDKTYICDYGYSSESRFFVPGPASVPTSFEVSSRDETSSFRFGLLIGADIRYPNLSQFLTADKDHRVDCIIQPTACFRDCAFRTWSSFQETRAVENSIYWIGVNYSGDDYGGTSIVQPFVDDDHEPITLDCDESYAIIQLSRETLDDVRSKFPFYCRLLDEESLKNDNELTIEDATTILNPCIVDDESKCSGELKSNNKSNIGDTEFELKPCVAKDASECSCLLESTKRQDIIVEPEKSNQSIVSSQDNYQAEKMKVESVAVPLCNTEKSRMDLSESVVDVSAKGSQVSKEKKVLSEEVRRKCYMWYTRLGHPSREQMKRRVLKLDASCDITVEDVDALPWIAGGTMLSATELNKLMLSN
jgi:predicted amidohydrolase